jgi:hypothetical protein
VFHTKGTKKNHKGIYKKLLCPHCGEFFPIVKPLCDRFVFLVPFVVKTFSSAVDELEVIGVEAKNDPQKNSIKKLCALCVLCGEFRFERVQFLL